MSEGNMNLFARIYESTIGRLLTSRPTTKRKRKNDYEDDSTSAGDEQSYVKRRRVHRPESGSDSHSTVSIENDSPPANLKHNASRRTMPPPNITPLKLAVDNPKKMTETGTMNTGLHSGREGTTEYDMERARRHAAATSLPDSSGAWEKGERELFYHLAYRGFEPIFPRHWMRQFDTMPLSLYQAEDDAGQLLGEPLIEVLNPGGDFLASKEFAALLQIGKDVRDRAISSPGIQVDAIIEKAINKYIAWAISDAGLKIDISNRRKSTSTTRTQSKLPVHVVTKRKKNQDITSMLDELKCKMHDLARKHRHARGIHESVEAANASARVNENENMDETQEIEQAEDDLPCLYGIAVTGPIMAVFTMNSQTPVPADETESLATPTSTDSFRPTRRPSRTTSLISDHTESKQNQKAELEANVAAALDRSNPRFISDFDFSKSGRDVWNSLVIAIFALQVRAELLNLEARGLLKTPITPLAPTSGRKASINNDPDA